MSELADYAPTALTWLGSQVRGLGGQLSGIVGDSAHTYGYHRGAAYIPSSDYSLRLPEDRQYPSAHMASGIDMSFNDSLMKLYTGRLKAAADRNDPRLKYVREFYGTLNGEDVYGRTHDGSADSYWEYATSDNSHLWHIHISILRKYCNNQRVMQGIYDVLAGKSSTTPSAPKGIPNMFVVYHRDVPRKRYLSNGIEFREIPASFARTLESKGVPVFNFPTYAAMKNHAGRETA